MAGDRRGVCAQARGAAYPDDGRALHGLLLIPLLAVRNLWQGVLTTALLGGGVAGMGFVLNHTGYNPTLPVQTASALWGLRLLVAVIPIGGLLIALIFLRAYPLDGARLEKRVPPR